MMRGYWALRLERSKKGYWFLLRTFLFSCSYSWLYPAANKMHLCTGWWFGFWPRLDKSKWKRLYRYEFDLMEYEWRGMLDRREC